MSVKTAGLGGSIFFSSILGGTTLGGSEFFNSTFGGTINLAGFFSNNLGGAGGGLGTY
jgi:hypothetical protein